MLGGAAGGAIIPFAGRPFSVFLDSFNEARSYDCDVAPQFALCISRSVTEHHQPRSSAT